MEGYISYQELVETLKGLRLWARLPGYDDTAFRVRALNPEDAAKDVFTSVLVRAQRADGANTQSR